MSSIRALEKSIREFSEFDRSEVHLQEWDRARFQRFVQWLITHKGYSDHTIYKYSLAFRRAMKSMDPSRDLSFTYYQVIQEPVHYLYESEILTIEQANSLPLYMEKTRNLLLLMCYTGLRHHQLRKLSGDNPTDLLLDILRVVGRNRSFPPLTAKAQTLLEKTGGMPHYLDRSRFGIYLKALMKYLRMDRPVPVKGEDGKIRVSSLCNEAGLHIARNTFIMCLLFNSLPAAEVSRIAGIYDFNILRPYLREYSRMTLLNYQQLDEVFGDLQYPPYID